MKIKLNQNLRGFEKNSILEIEADKDNIPLCSYWRQRLEDSKIDNCIEIVDSEKTRTITLYPRWKCIIKFDKKDEL